MGDLLSTDNQNADHENKTDPSPESNEAAAPSQAADLLVSVLFTSYYFEVHFVLISCCLSYYLVLLGFVRLTNRSI